MTQFLDTLDEETLGDKLEDAIDLGDTSIESPEGDEMEMPEQVKQSIQSQNVADTIADHLSKVAVDSDGIASTKLVYGSGDTGRQTKLSLYPVGTVSTDDDEDASPLTIDELREIAFELDIILSEIMPMEYLVGVTNDWTIDDDGYPDEKDDHYLFLVYNARSHGPPTPPAGESTEVINASELDGIDL